MNKSCANLISNPLQPGPLGPDLGQLGGGVLESRTERNTLSETGLAQENRSLRYYHAGLLHKNRWGWDQMIGWWWWSSPRRLPNIILGAVPCDVTSAILPLAGALNPATRPTVDKPSEEFALVIGRFVLGPDAAVLDKVRLDLDVGFVVDVDWVFSYTCSNTEYSLAIASESF